MLRSHLPDEVEAVHPVVHLCHREHFAATDLLQPSLRPPWLIDRPDVVGIVTEFVAYPPCSLATITEIKRGRIGCLPWHDPYGSNQAAIPDGDFDMIAIHNVDPFCKRRTDGNDVAPCQGHQRLWQFLQPTDIGELAVPNSRVGPEYDIQFITV